MFAWIRKLIGQVRITTETKEQRTQRDEYLYAATLANVYRHAVDLIPALEYSLTLKMYLKLCDPTSDFSDGEDKRFVVAAIDLETSPFWSILAIGFILGDFSQGQVDYYLSRCHAEDRKFCDGLLKDKGQQFEVDMIPRKALSKADKDYHTWLRLNFDRKLKGVDLIVDLNQANVLWRKQYVNG